MAKAKSSKACSTKGCRKKAAEGSKCADHANTSSGSGADSKPLIANPKVEILLPDHGRSTSKPGSKKIRVDKVLRIKEAKSSVPEAKKSRKFPSDHWRVANKYSYKEPVKKHSVIKDKGICYWAGFASGAVSRLVHRKKK